MRLSVRSGGGDRDASAEPLPGRSRGQRAVRKLARAGVLASVLGTLVAAATAAASPPKPVTCGDLITAPGQYFLASDCTGKGIRIAASDVHLKLDGHTLDGSGCSFSVGIESRGVARLHIQGPGTITGYFVGISFDSVNDSHVQKVTLSDDCSNGVLASGSRDQFNQNLASSNGSGFEVAGTDNRYVNNTADRNKGAGIGVQPASRNNLVEGNEATNNGRDGIALNTSAIANKIHGNTAVGNGSFDLRDSNAGCDSNDWAGNRFGTANQPCIS